MTQNFYVLIYSFILGVILNISPLKAQVSDKPYKDKLVLVENKLQAGDIQAALGVIEEILAAYPTAAEVFYAKALIYGQIRNFDTAIPAAISAYELEKHNSLYANYLLGLYKSKADFGSALKLVDELLKSHPTAPQIHREKILLLHTSKQSELALQSYDEAVNSIGQTDTLDVLKAEILIDLKRFNEAKPILLSWEKKKSTLRQIYSALGYIYLQENNPKEAILSLENGVKNSKDEHLYLDLADALVANKKNNQAFEFIKKAFNSDMIEYLDKHQVMQTVINGPEKLTMAQKQELANVLVFKYPRIADTHIYKADLLWQKMQLSEARSVYLTAIGINARHVDAWRKLINVELALNDYDSAIAHGQEAMSHNPNNAILTYFTAVGYLLKKDNVNARAYLEQALNNSTQENNFVQSMIYGSLGDLYHELEMQSASDVAYEEAIRLDENNASALNNYAYYLSLRKKDLVSAAKYALKANELEPNSGTFQDTYAWVLFQQGNYPEALTWIEKAIKNSDPSAVVYEHYGDILMMNGKAKEAIKQWEKALSLTANDIAKSDKIKQKISEKKYID